MAMRTLVVAVTTALLVLSLGNAASATTTVEEECLAAHNKVRAAVEVAPLEWSEKLAAYAQHYAEQQRDHHKCALAHSRGPYGENLFWGSGKPFTQAHAVRSWADEGRDYDYESNSCSPGKVCGHYTQVVWADTKTVGCAAVDCHDDGATFVICSYDPPGNFVGEKPYQRGGGGGAKVSQHHHHHHHSQQDRDVKDRNVNVATVAEGEDDDGRDGEKFDGAEAKLCQCMLSCVSKSQSWQRSSSKQSSNLLATIAS